MISDAALLNHALFFLVLLTTSAVVTWAMARYVRVMDVPTARSSHTRPTPRSGGVAIAATFLLGTVAVYVLGDEVRIADQHLAGVVTCSLAVAAVSYWDDITQRSFLAKLTAQLLCTLAVLSFGLVVRTIYLPGLGEVSMGWAGYLFTALWMVGLTNTVNFMDGLDGLVGGVCLVAVGFLGYIAYASDSRMVYVLCYALGAGVAGFLVFNWSPAKIFMGDVGSAFLGFTLATLAVVGASLDHGHLSFYVVPLLVLNLIFDATVTLARRALAGERLHHAHRGHLYQLLNRMGWGHAAVATLYVSMAVAQGLAALVLVRLPVADRGQVVLAFLAAYALYAWLVLKAAGRRGLLSRYG